VVTACTAAGRLTVDDFGNGGRSAKWNQDGSGPTGSAVKRVRTVQQCRRLACGIPRIGIARYFPVASDALRQLPAVLGVAVADIFPVAGCERLLIQLGFARSIRKSF